MYVAAKVNGIAWPMDAIGEVFDFVPDRERRKVGTSLAEIASAANAMGLYCEAVECPTGDLRHLPPPVILHTETERGSHYVVLLGEAGGGNLAIVNPGRGFRKVPESKLADVFTGYALIVSQAPIELEGRVGSPSPAGAAGAFCAGVAGSALVLLVLSRRRHSAT